MLYTLIGFKKILRSSSAFLFFISSITFHTLVSADIQEETAEKYRALGYAEQQKGNLNEALANYTKATTLGIENPVVFNDMGVLYENIEMISRAEHYYLSAIKLDPEYLPAYNNLAYFYQKLGKTDKAVEYFKLRYQLGDPQEYWAQKAKNELLKLRPEYADWIFSMEAKALNGELVKKSRDEFERHMEESQEHFIKGAAHFKEEKYDEAMKEYDSALRITPNNPKIKKARDQVILAIAKKSIREYSDQAIRRLEVGDTISARQDIQRILTTIPDKPMLISR